MDAAVATHIGTQPTGEIASKCCECFRPGRILCFWQGIVEMVIRITCITLDVGALVTAVLTSVQLNPIPDNYGVSNDTDQFCVFCEARYYIPYIPWHRIDAVYLLVVTSCILVLETLVITLRFLNCSRNNYYYYCIWFLDVVFSGWLALSFIPGALPAAVYAANTWKNDEQYPQLYPLFAVLASLCFLTMQALLFQMAWVTVFLVKNWNTKLKPPYNTETAAVQ